MSRVTFLAVVVLTGCTCDTPDRVRRDGGADSASALDAPFAFPDAADSADAHSGEDAVSDDASGSGDASSRDAGEDAPTAGDSGCVPGTSRACEIACGMGSTAPGRQVCFGSGAWSPCERASETCGNAMDDDADGRVDEGCRDEGGCVWIRASRQGLGTLNEWCARAGGRRLVEGRRCPVAGGAVVPLDAMYGEYQLACCDVASMCRPECVGEVCASSVVWDEIRCCP